MNAPREVRSTTGRLFAAGFVACACSLCLGTATSTRSGPRALPSARPATASERLSFQKFAPARSGWKINEYAVAGRYAVVGFYCSNGGVTALLVRETAGNWVLVTRGGAQITPDFMVRAIPAMEISVAQRLYDLVMSQDRP